MTCSRRRACIGDAGCEADGFNCWYEYELLAAEAGAVVDAAALAAGIAAALAEA